MSVMYESAYDAITFVITWNEFHHNTHPETILNIRTRYIGNAHISGFVVQICEQ